MAANERSADRIKRVGTLDWTPVDSGYVKLSNYWLRFWRPYLGPKASMLYEQILAYRHEGSEECCPAMDTLADSIGVDKRTIYGWRLKDDAGNPIIEHGEIQRKPGLLHILRDHGLLVWERDDDGWSFDIRVTTPLLSDEQVAQLRPPLQGAHRDWIQRCAPEAYQNARSMVPTTADQNQNARSMVTTTAGVVATTAAVVPTTRTIPINIPHQQREDLNHTDAEVEGATQAPAANATNAFYPTPFPPVPAALARAWEAAVYASARDLPPPLAHRLRPLHPLGYQSGALILTGPAWWVEWWACYPEHLATVRAALPLPDVVTRLRVVATPDTAAADSAPRTASCSA